MFVRDDVPGLTYSDRAGQAAIEPPAVVIEPRFLKSTVGLERRARCRSRRSAAAKECENDEALARCRGRHAGSEAAQIASGPWVTNTIAAAAAEQRGFRQPALASIFAGSKLIQNMQSAQSSL